MIEVVDRVPTYPNRIRITREDGSTELVTWERADEPTVEGTPINKALFDSIKADIGTGLSANKTIYVSGAGSDVLGDGSSTNPYASVGKALNSLPKNLNGFVATLHLFAGSYDEDVNITGFFGGTIVFLGDSGINVSIRSLRIGNGVLVEIQNVEFEITGGYSGNAVAIANASLVCSTRMRITGAVENGVYISRGGLLVVTNDFEVANVIGTAVQALNHARVSLNTISGDMVSGVFIRANNGARVSYSVMNASAPVVFSTGTGGRIYSGAQTEIPKY